MRSILILWLGLTGLLHAASSNAPASRSGVRKGYSDLCWKRETLDSAGRPVWIDSIVYDSAGKRLQEWRRGPEGVAVRSLRFEYDHAGRSTAVREFRESGPTGLRATQAIDGDFLIRWEFLPGHKGEERRTRLGRRLIWVDSGPKGAIYAYSGDTDFTFDECGTGVCRTATRSSKTGKEPDAYGRFTYDKAGRHVSSRFLGADSQFIGCDTVIRDPEGKPRERILRAADGTIRARTEWGYGTRGELVSLSDFRDSSRFLRGERFHWVAADSVRGRTRAHSIFKGPPRGRLCALTLEGALELGFESRSLDGLFLPQTAPRIRSGRKPRSRDRDTQAPDTAACAEMSGDAVDERCAYHADRVARRAGLALLDSCRVHPASGCTEPVYALVERVMKRKVRDEGGEISLDSLASGLLALEKDAAYHRLAAMLVPDTLAAMRQIELADALLLFRMSRAYERFIASPARYVPPGPGPPRAEADAARPDGFTWSREILGAWKYRTSILGTSRSGESAGAREPVRNSLESLAPLIDFVKSHPSVSGTAGSRRIRFAGFPEFGPFHTMRMVEALESGDLPMALSGNFDPAAQKAMLQSRGLDWERFLLGGLVGGVERGNEVDPETIPILAGEGSPETIRALLTLYPDKEPERELPDGYIAALGSLLTGPGSALSAPLAPSAATAPMAMDADEEDWAVFRRSPSAPPLPESIRQEALAQLMDRVDRAPYHPDGSAGKIFRVFSALEWPGKAEYLGKLASLPLKAARDSAGAVPDSLGLGMGSPEPLEPVAFRFYSRGAPLPEFPFSYGDSCLPRQPVTAALEAPGPEIRSGFTDSSGGFQMDRMEYLRFRRSSGGFCVFESYLFGADNPVFSVPIDFPARPKDPVPIELRLSRVVMIPKFPAGFVPAQEARIVVGVPGASRLRSDRDITLDPADSLVFDQWGMGAYPISIRIPGLRQEDFILNVGGNGARRIIALSRGTDIRFRLDLQGAKDGEQTAVHAELMDAHGTSIGYSHAESQEERVRPALTGEWAAYAGIAPGDYRLKVLSSGELAAWLRRKGYEPFDSPYRYHKGVAYQGAVIPIHVPENGPEELDLGAIILKRARRE